jgi:hypothetical protein
MTPTLYDSLLELTKRLAERAEATGQTTTAKFGDGTKQLILRDGKIAGWYRIMSVEISVMPVKIRKRRKPQK